jgi:acyl carrier protein
MSIRSTVVLEIQQIAGQHDIDLPPLAEGTVLVESGLDSLAIAILVARLEDALGFDPFSECESFPAIVTLGDLVRFYEDNAKIT